MIGVVRRGTPTDAPPLDYYVACIRCAVQHPERPATPLAAFGGPGVAPFLYSTERVFDDFGRAEDGTIRTDYWQAIGARLTTRYTEAVTLYCPNCGHKVGPITGKTVAKH